MKDNKEYWDLLEIEKHLQDEVKVIKQRSNKPEEFRESLLDQVRFDTE